MGHGAASAGPTWPTKLVSPAKKRNVSRKAGELSHARVVQLSEEDAEEDDDDDGEDGEEEDTEGVRVGRFGRLEVVADEDSENEPGAETFDQDEYRKTMEALKRGFMTPNDLHGMDVDCATTARIRAAVMGLRSAALEMHRLQSIHSP